MSCPTSQVASQHHVPFPCPLSCPIPCPIPYPTSCLIICPLPRPTPCHVPFHTTPCTILHSIRPVPSPPVPHHVPSHIHVPLCPIPSLVSHHVPLFVASSALCPILYPHHVLPHTVSYVLPPPYSIMSHHISCPVCTVPPPMSHVPSHAPSHTLYPHSPYLHTDVDVALGVGHDIGSWGLSKHRLLPIHLQPPASALPVGQHQHPCPNPNPHTTVSRPHLAAITWCHSPSLTGSSETMVASPLPSW